MFGPVTQPRTKARESGAVYDAVLALRKAGVAVTRVGRGDHMIDGRSVSHATLKALAESARTETEKNITENIPETPEPPASAVTPAPAVASAAVEPPCEPSAPARAAEWDAATGLPPFLDRRGAAPFWRANRSEAGA
jgi:hypothetical protein